MTREVPLRRRLLSAGYGVVVMLALAGCGSGGGTAPLTSATPTTPSGSVSDSASGSPTGPPSDAPSATPTPTVSTDAPATPTGSPTSSPALAICADLTVTVTRVPGAAGVTYGLVTVTSRSGSRCSLPGVPSLRLLDASRAPMTAVATATSPSDDATSLDPGGVASTLLEDSSATCQANTRSAYVEVKATTAAATVVVALSLPPCSLSVKPFVPGTSPAP